jgi:hypothetical protein
MQLEVVKVEEGLCAGRVLFHSVVSRTPAEAAAQQAGVEERQRLRAERRRQQARPPAVLLPRAQPVAAEGKWRGCQKGRPPAPPSSAGMRSRTPPWRAGRPGVRCAGHARLGARGRGEPAD